MFKKLFDKLKAKKEEKNEVNRISFLMDLPNKEEDVLRLLNKELTDLQPFFDLLDNFKYFPIKGYYLQQNINEEIISFAPNIYDVCNILSKVKFCTQHPNQETINMIRRLPKHKYGSYLFFAEGTHQTMGNFDQKALDQIVDWMKDILDYYEKHKLIQGISNLSGFIEILCSALFSVLDVFYDFFYNLLCHVANIKCDQYKRIAMFVSDDF